MKVDLTFELRDLNNEIIATASKIIAGLLMSELKGNAEKLFDWAISLNKNEVIEMDNADFAQFKEIIRNSERISIMAKAPILKYLNTLK